jgi:predicted GNAT family acetyltransferase
MQTLINGIITFDSCQVNKKFSDGGIAVSDEEIQHDLKNQKFFIVIDEYEAVLEYRKQDSELEYYHTFVPEALRGKGLAEKLVTAALEYAKQNNFSVKPTCSYVARYISRHQEWATLIKE